MNTQKPAKELTREEKDQIIKERIKGLSIRDIALKLHISDRRVAAFLKPIEAEVEKQEKQKKAFNKYADYAATLALKSAQELVSVIQRHIMEFIFEAEQVKNGKLNVKKGHLEKVWKRRREECLEGILSAMMHMAIWTVWTIPPAYKKLWLATKDEMATIMKTAMERGQTQVEALARKGGKK